MPVEVDKFLGPISNVESSGGKDRVHDVVTKGVNKGTRSISSYGIMPRTAYELAQKDKEFGATPLGQGLLATGGDANAINDIAGDPANDEQITRALIKSNMRRLQKAGVPEAQLQPAIAFAHRRGMGAAQKALAQQKDFGADPYVQAVEQNMPLDQNSSSEDNEQNKMKLDILSRIAKR